MHRRPGLPFGRTLLAIWPWPAAIWLGVTVTTLIARPATLDADLPIHAVAWWTWSGQAAATYLPEGGAEWPPLLFWCIRLSWSLFGVSESWARLITALFGLASLGLVAALARRLWPDDGDTPRYAPIVLAGSGGFVAYLATTAFAWPLMWLTLLSLYGIVLARRQHPVGGWAIFAVALFLGELSAGAAALWLMLPIALAALWVARREGQASRQRGLLSVAVATSLALAATVALALAVLPHMPIGGEHGLLARLLLRRPLSPGDIDQPWFWYLFMAILLLYPWLWWTSLWRTIGRARAEFASPEMRLCVSAAAIIFAVVLATGRQTTEMLPALPPAALVIARIWARHAGKAKDFHAALPGLMALFVCLFFFMLNIVPVAHLDAVWQRVFDDDLPVWLGGISLASGMTLLTGSYLLALLTPRTSLARLVQLALLPVLLALTVNLEFAVSLRQFFDLTPVAQKIRALEEAGRPVAVYPAYEGAFDLTGRLPAPPQVVDSLPAALAWAAANPDGIVVSYFRGGILHMPEQPLYLGPAEDFRAALWTSATVLHSRAAVLQPKF